jgi:putative peptide zinc metalloprotease protein
MADAPTTPTAERLVLVVPGGTRIPIDRPLTIGRGDDASVRIPDRTVSRTHARVMPAPGGAMIEDAGSTFGTLLAGVRLTSPERLHAGVEIRVGDVVLNVEDETPTPPAPPDVATARGAGKTIVVPIDATLHGLRAPQLNYDGARRPRVRSGYALKRLDESEGDKRFILRDLLGHGFLRMSEPDAALFELLDGERTVTELLIAAERAGGPTAPGRLAALIAELADRGLLDGTEPATGAPRETALQRVFKPREKSFTWVSDYFPRAYQHWGRALFSHVMASLLALLALAGVGVFAYLVGVRFGTPFVVANRLIIGGAVFLAGRFVLAAAHETAHGLALAHYKRRAARAGLRLILIFPYAFVDTSEGYFEPRKHRIVISAAGPASDLTFGALFSIACLVAPQGSLRDVFFQLAFAAYVGAFFNLNPFLDRDGYSILVDFLREPGLRSRARRQLAARLSGAPRAPDDSPVLARYAVAGVVWSLIGAGVAIAFSHRYYDRLKAYAPHQVVLTAFIVFWVILLIPVLLQLGLPLVRRARFGAAEVNRVIR